MNQFLFKATLTLFLILVLFTSRARSMEDVIHFKNGAVLQGQVLEEDPSSWVKIKTPDGATRTYNMNDVEYILKADVPPLGLNGGYAAPPGPSTGAVVSQAPGTAFLLSFLLPGLGCYVNGGDDTKIGLLCDGLYVGGIVLMVAAGYDTTITYDAYGYPYSTITTSPFLWVGAGVALSGWVLGMIDAPAYASSHQARPNTYGDLLDIPGPGYELGLGLSPIASLGGNSLSAPLPSVAFRF